MTEDRQEWLSIIEKVSCDEGQAGMPVLLIWGR
jgi:hypothetical protein